MISAQNIKVCYGTCPVLQEVSVDAPAGKVTAILGPNGAGKSTLMHALTGAMQVVEGKVTFDGKTLSGYSPDALARRRAVLPQRSQLGFNFTVNEVVEMGRLPHLRSCDPDHHAAILDAVMAALDISYLAARHYQTLSGGERQRVDLARVLAQVWPEEGIDARTALFLDEPTNNLDIRHQHDCLAVARKMAAKGLAVVCVLHDLNLALRYADRCLLLNRGKLAASGPKEDVLTEAELSDVFGVQVSLLQTTRGLAILTEPK